MTATVHAISAADPARDSADTETEAIAAMQNIITANTLFAVPVLPVIAATKSTTATAATTKTVQVWGESTAFSLFY